MEIWRAVPGFEGRYEVSDLGRVRSTARSVRAVSKAGREYQRRVEGVNLRPGLSRGYFIVHLYPRGTVAVHLLVARAFVAGAAAGLEVNHIDGDKKNNAARNLEWTSRRGNQIHAVAAGLKTQAVRVVHPLTGAVFPSISQAAESSGLHHRTVSTSWRRA